MSQFTVIDEHNIRFGLYAIKKGGQEGSEMSREQRKTGEKVHDVEDFVKRTQNKNFNKKSWEALVKSGALDSLGERNQLLASTEMILELSRSQSKQTNQPSLFGAYIMPQTKLQLPKVEPATK